MQTRQIAIGPATSPNNRFVDLFSDAFSSAGWDVSALAWEASDIPRGPVVMHWPNEFFAPRSLRQWIRVLKRLWLMTTTRIVRGTRWIWVAHDHEPPENRKATWTWRALLGRVDAIIYLSQHSRDQLEASQPSVRRKAALVTRHGDYRTGARTAPTIWRPVSGKVKLGHMGWIRPYKNVEALIRAAGPLAGEVELHIAGRISDSVLERKLTAAAALTPVVSLNLRREALDEAEMEGAVDACDAVVLPYRKITNSGNALLALSRNRPIIVPAIGSMPELRDAVGSDWVFLYEGEISAEVLREAAQWVRRPRPEVCPLDDFSWSVVGPEIVEFVAKL